MDLATVAQILADDRQPDRFRLQEQRYKMMAEEYKRSKHSAEFPLESFAVLCTTTI